MLEALLNPGSMSQSQWLIIGILLILVVGIFYFVYRTYLVISESGKKQYKPNIGLSRLDESAADNSAADDLDKTAS